jgi:hypothetical protein
MGSHRTPTGKSRPRCHSPLRCSATRNARRCRARFPILEALWCPIQRMPDIKAACKFAESSYSSDLAESRSYASPPRPLCRARAVSCGGDFLKVQETRTVARASCIVVERCWLKAGFAACTIAPGRTSGSSELVTEAKFIWRPSVSGSVISGTAISAPSGADMLLGLQNGWRRPMRRRGHLLASVGMHPPNGCQPG